MIPTSPLLRQRVGLVNKIGNFGAWPPTVAYRDSRLKGQGILLKIGDPAVGTPALAADQVAGVRSHGVWCGFWQPVPPADDLGAERAAAIDRFLDGVDKELARRGQPKLLAMGLNMEGYTVKQCQEFLWGDVVNGIPRPGFRVLRPGLACWWIDAPFQDGSVRPMGDLMLARMMLAVEEFYGKGWDGDMTPADGQRSILDRIEGRRADGTTPLLEQWPSEQVVACYDAGRGVESRFGLHFTLDRAREFGVI